MAHTFYSQREKKAPNRLRLGYRWLLPTTLCLLTCSISSVAIAKSKSSISGYAELEQRFFLEEAPVANRQRNYQAIGGELQYSFSANRGRETFTATLGLRKDFDDPEREYIELLDLDAIISNGPFEFRFGVRRVFWGVTEAVHLVDVINQTNLQEGVDTEDKLGQAMVNLAWFSPFGTWEGFVMPFFRERLFPGPEGRFSTPFELLPDDARYAEEASVGDVSLAVRWTHSLFDMDIGLSYFEGNNREPRIAACLREGSGFEGTDDDHFCDFTEDDIDPQLGLLGELILQGADSLPEGSSSVLGPLIQQVADNDNSGTVPNEREIRQRVFDSIVLVPIYEPSKQFGLDWQYNIGDLALKAEARRRLLRDEWQTAAAGGFEYTLVGVFGSAIDVGLLGEYLYNQDNEPVVADFDQDWFAGTRIEFNDVATTRIIAAVIQDRENYARYYSIDATRRLGQNWSMALEGLWLSNIPDDDPATFFADEDFMLLQLRRFF